MALPKCDAFLHAYVRTSFGFSEAEQRRTIQERYAGQEIDWHRDSADKGSVPFGNRPGGLRFASALERGDIAVFARIDVVFRNLYDLRQTTGAWTARGVRLHFLDLGTVIDPAAEEGKEFLRIVEALADFERARAVDRVQRMTAKKRVAGKRLNGNVPPGFKLVGRPGRRRPAIDKHDAAIAKKIAQWKLSGYTFNEIYFHLLRHGVETSAGREWSRTRCTSAFRSGCLLLAEEGNNQGQSA